MTQATAREQAWNRHPQGNRPNCPQCRRSLIPVPLLDDGTAYPHEDAVWACPPCFAHYDHHGRNIVDQETAP